MGCQRDVGRQKNERLLWVDIGKGECCVAVAATRLGRGRRRLPEPDCNHHTHCSRSCCKRRQHHRPCSCCLRKALGCRSLRCLVRMAPYLDVGCDATEDRLGCGCRVERETTKLGQRGILTGALIMRLLAAGFVCLVHLPACSFTLVHPNHKRTMHVKVGLEFNHH
jgi:hypothetical protein